MAIKMIFNSLTYFIFLFAVVILYWSFSLKARLYLVFFSSLLFYGFWKVEFIPVMLISVISDYLLALKISINTNKVIKKRLLLLSLVINLGILFYFKYLIFFAENAIGFANLVGISLDPLLLKIILPLGISFYTFQTISYTVDVYRGQILPEKNFILYACYVTFFPQLIAGPVLRASEVIYQFSKKSLFKFEHIIIGCRRILYGLFLKVVIADNIAPLVDSGFSMPIEAMGALDVWTLGFLFGFQIYFDFSAYSHIAIGSARLLGIHFPENFNFPYLANSPKDFWRRWHISLSSWIRDYLYLPLAGIKAGNKSLGGLEKVTLNKNKNKPLFIAWAIMGLWHGASWTFVLWGLYHAIVIFVYRLLLPILKNFNQNLKVFFGIFVTLPIMMLAWIPFRAESISDTFSMWLKVLNPNSYGILGMQENTYLISAFLLFSIFISSTVKNKLLPLFDKDNRIILIYGEILLFSVMIPLIIIFLRPVNQFIYFQF